MRAFVNADEFESSPLKDALPQLLRDAQRRDEDGTVVAGSERFKTLADATYDVVAWGFHFYRYPLAFRRQCYAVHECVAGACRLH